MYDTVVLPTLRQWLAVPDFWARCVRMGLETYAEVVGRFAHAAFPPFFHNGHKSRLFESLQIGEKAKVTVRITHAHLLYFARASGDWNPLHFSYLYAAGTRFEEPIAHGLLVGASFSALIASELPGQGTLYESQSFLFKAPVYIGDEVTTEIEIMAIEPDKRRVTLKGVGRNQGGEVVIEGEAVVRVPRTH
jgi:acyl dehydratase